MGNVENQEACAKLTAADEKAKFWMYNLSNKKCWIKTSKEGKRELKSSVSGNREFKNLQPVSWDS